MDELTHRALVLNLMLAIAGAFAIGQISKASRSKPAIAKPQRSKGAICFSGEASKGAPHFRKALTATLDFVISLPSGIDVVSLGSKDPCKLSAWVANPPLMAQHDTEIDAAYDWTAEAEVQTSPREFRFPTNCPDFERLRELAQTDAEKYFAQLPSLAKGHGRLWITDSRVTHTHGGNGKTQGAVEWLKFSVEIKLPNSP